MTKVFISSTYRDNVERRRWVEQGVATVGMVAVGMERFEAEARETVDAVRERVRECDVMVVVVAHRYGWVPEGEERSITEIEYDTAGECGIDRLVLIVDESVPVDMRADFDEGEDWWGKQGKLQAFKKKIGGELTARFTRESLQAKVQSSLQRWERGRGKAAAAPAPKVGEELARYYDKLRALHGQVSLVGFPSGRVRVPIRLEDLHVPLDAMIERGNCVRMWSAEQAVLGLGLGGSQRVALMDAFGVAEKLGQRGLVLLGDPGSGKTTHLKRVLLQIIEHGADSIGLPADTVPVFLALRNLRDREAGISAFIQQELRDPLRDLPEDFGERLVRERRLLLLFDGLDEVASDEERVAIKAWIERTHEGGSHRFLVSCRYAGYGDEVRLDRQQFLQLHLRSLSDDQAEQFVRNWYTKVEAVLATDPDEAARLAEQGADDLLKTLRSPEFRVAQVFAMAHNPLLLTGICLVHRDRGTLPTGRVRLYADCIDVLLERWRKEAKGLGVTVPAEDARKVLQPVARWLHEQEGRTRATADELRGAVDGGLAGLRTKVKTADEFLVSVRNESGLLTGWGDGSFGFMHLGFQEYLAARELRTRGFADGEVWEWLAARLGEPWWQEVILLMLAVDEPAAFEPFMRAVVRRGEFAKLWNSDVMRFAMEEAAGRVAGPFVELIEEGDEGDELEARQLAAARLLRESMPEAFAGLRPRLARHPVGGVRALVAGWLAPREVVRGVGSERAEVITANEGGYELVLIPGGSFLMGATEEEAKRFEYPDEAYEYWGFPNGVHPERPQQQVELGEFYLGRNPVTNEEYARYLEARPSEAEPELWGDRKFNQPDQPVVGISWDEARAYCTWAGLQLPTEAQWEYACRAGTTTRYWVGDDPAQLEGAASYGGDYEKGQPQPVGQSQPNPFGLRDMHGNVWEWCEDWFGLYEGREPTTSDGLRGKPEGARFRVVRGGSWLYGAAYLRSALRNGSGPGDRFRYLGFRPARVITK